MNQSKNKLQKTALMVCTHARGGMRSVVEAYERDGVFEAWAFESLWTHDEGSFFNKILIAVKAYLKLFYMLIFQRVSFMHVHSAMRGSFWRKSLFILTAQCFGVASIMHLHGSEMQSFYYRLPKFGKWAVRWILEHVDLVIVLSNSWYDFVHTIAPKASIAVLNNYVTLPAHAPIQTFQKRFDVLFLGVLGHRKGIYDLLKAWPGILIEVPHARLLVGGNGEIEKAQMMAQELGISGSVQFLGWIDGDRKSELLANADAFVLPSYNEGLPMSVLEAMSWQKAVVTTNVGGIPELIKDGENGVLIEPGSQAQLANALIKIGIDLNFRLSLGANARQHVLESFSNTSVLPKLESLYSKISNFKKI